jgi:hypothetical protein
MVGPLAPGIPLPLFIHYSSEFVEGLGGNSPQQEGSATLGFGHKITNPAACYLLSSAMNIKKKIYVSANAKAVDFTH